MDEFGGQALYEQRGRWFRISFDDDWLPVELNGRNEALRCTFVAPYQHRNEEFPNANTLINSVQTEWGRSLDVEDVPLSEVVHLFPRELRRAWETAQQVRQAEEDWHEYQARRRREQGEPQRREREPSLQPVRWPPPPLPALPPVPLNAEIWEMTARYMRQAIPCPNWPLILPFDVEDVLANASYRVAAYLEDNEGLFRELRENPPRFEAYVLEAFFRERADIYRTIKRRPAMVSLAEAPEEALQVSEPQPSRAAHLSELREIVEGAIELLPEREAHVVRHFFYPWPPGPPGRTNAEVAAELGMSRSTVSRIRNRALVKLRESLARSGIGPEDF